MKSVLLLAGTAEARALARRFDLPDARLVASLAGATNDPIAYRCEIRTGGFGGEAGLRRYLEAEEVVALIDATHPFASGISANATVASEATGISLLTLTRPPWTPIGDWHPFPDLAAAIAALPPEAHVLATTGRKETADLFARADLRVTLRSVDPPPDPPPHVHYITARGPFTLESETDVMRDRAITHLLTRNSGGESRARLDAAAALGIPLHIVERPSPPAANAVSTVADALDWLRTVLRD